MRAIVVRQPWATLIALGIKTIETRPAPPNGEMRPGGVICVGPVVVDPMRPDQSVCSRCGKVFVGGGTTRHRAGAVRGLPGCSLARGERIAIVAGAQIHTPPNDAYVWSDDRSGWWVDDAVWRVSDERPTGEGWWLERWSGDEVVPATEPLPLGAVVCTVTVDDALPIVGEYDNVQDRELAVSAGHALTAYSDRHDSEGSVLDDQLPLGDFTPGRWGWMLSDPQPCEPIPCMGRQGVFELPPQIAEALS